MIKNTILLIFVAFLFVLVLSHAPADFPKGRFDFHIDTAESISAVGQDLKAKKIISSEFLFKLYSFIFSKGRGVQAGDYRFSYAQNTWVIAYRMVKGQQGQSKVRVTIPEGTNIADMAFLYAKSLPEFDAPYFVAQAKRYEGYLYPDTYYFFENVKIGQIISTMRDTFDEKTKTLDTEIKASGKSLKDIVTMASIVEEEVLSYEDRQKVAGIMWKRIDEGMLLQVDSPFYFVTGRRKISKDDLKIETPYNTYKYKGLPPGPISNPSLSAIKATMNPVKTDYYFYISGKDGKTRYAKNYDEHLTNIQKYLKI